MMASRLLSLVLVLLLLAGRPAGARVPETDDEAPASLPAGLVARYQPLDGSAEVHRVEPVPRLYGAADDGVHPTLRGPFEVSWAGKVIVPDRTYTFHFEPCSLEDVTLTVGGKAVRPGQAVKLPPGMQSFVLRGTHRKGTPAFGLSWQGPKFVREAVPPRAFVHDPADEKDEALRRQVQADRGAVLVELFGCFRCHEGPKAWTEGQGRLATAEQLLPGPRLDGAGERLRAGWVRAWLADPQAVQPGARMPALFGDSPTDRDALDIIAAWLSGRPDAAPARPTGSAEKGKHLYAASGCASCHEAPKGTERPPAPALEGMVAKWTAGGLADFLRRPLATRAHGRMPDFGFTAEEAADLAAHLLARPVGQTSLSAAAPPSEEQLRRQWRALGEDPARLAALPPAGRLRAVALRQIVVYGCVNCHAVSAEADLGIARKSSGAPAAKTGKAVAGGPLAGLPAEKPPGGCLTEGGQRGRAPRWSLARGERESLLAHLAQLRPDSPSSLAESVRIDLRLFNCTACHRNEGAGGEALTQALGGPAAAKWRTPPDLTGVAARLRPARFFEYLRHGAGRRPLRPWLGARMPGFGERGGRLALGLLARDGFGNPKTDWKPGGRRSCVRRRRRPRRPPTTSRWPASSSPAAVWPASTVTPSTDSAHRRPPIPRHAAPTSASSPLTCGRITSSACCATRPGSSPAPPCRRCSRPTVHPSCPSCVS
jgi:cytochrome c553